MAHNRKLVIGVVSLTIAKIRGDIPILSEVRDELEQLLIQSNYLDGAPFKWVGMILRYGLKNDASPVYEKINSKHGDLPLAIEIDTHELIGASKEQMKHIFTKATLIALIDAGRKYNLPVAALENYQS